MNTGPTCKRIAFLLIGGLLTVGCGLLVWMGMILSWRSPWHDWETFLTFILHPVTLLLFVGLGLFIRGILMRETAKGRHEERS